VPESAAQQDEIIRGIAATEEEEELEAQQEVSEYSDSSDDDYQPIPQMPPRRHDAEAGSSSSAPPALQTDPTLIAILERMQQDQTRQAQEAAANFAQFRARQDEFQRQQLLQHQQLLMQQQLMGFMQHVVTVIGVPLPQPSPQLAQPPTTSTTPAVQPSGLQSQGQPPAQFASPLVQVSQ
jgi:hypothetical protein